MLDNSSTSPPRRGASTPADRDAPRPRSSPRQRHPDPAGRHRAGVPAVQRPARELHLGHERGRPLGASIPPSWSACARRWGSTIPLPRALRQVRRQARHGRSRHLVPHPRAGDQADRRARLAVAEAGLRRHGLRHPASASPLGFLAALQARQHDRHRLDGHRHLRPVAVAVLVRPDADVPVRADAELAAELRLRRRRPAQPDPAGHRAGRRPDGAAGAHHARRRARRAQRRFRAHRPQQGHERAPGREMARRCAMRWCW